MNNQRAIFLDRDGTINIDKGYISHYSDIVLFPDALEALKILNGLGRLIIVTNQSGIARGFYSESTLDKLHKKMLLMLKGHGVTIDGIYFCPHHPQAGENPKRCGCRKPEPGMLLAAAADLDINLEKSYMIGDKSSDVGAGQRVSAKTVFIASKNNAVNPALPEIKFDTPPDFIASTLLEAARWIQGDIA